MSWLLAAVVVILLSGVAFADDPLPAPRALPDNAPVYFPTMPIYRRSAYDVWQFYGVDRQGRFRPRVIYSPSGAYYLYNGVPFPWTITHPIEFMPYAVD